VDGLAQAERVARTMEFIPYVARVIDPLLEK
jgi:hypothetical protein